MEYASYSEAPRYMHFWTGVSTIAACLQRKVWIDQYYFKWYPNFYIIIVAPPGIVAKSTTSGIGYKLLKEIEEVNIGADIVTWQSIVEAFQQAETTFYFDGQEHTMCAISYNSEELGNLIDLKDKGLVNLLIKLWDGSDIKKTTRHKGDNEITNSWINLIGCTTPAWINENMTENIIQGGLTSRCLFLYADEKEKVVSYPGLLDRSKAEQQRNDLIHDLKEINKLVGSFTMTPEAIDWGIKWYNNHIANLDTVAREKGALGIGGDVAGDGFDKTEVGGAVGPETVGLGRGVDADKDDVGPANRGGDVSGKGEVPSPRFPDKLVESRFVDRQLVRVPRGNSRGIDINDLDMNVRTFRGDHRHGGAADVTGTDAGDICHGKGVIAPSARQ